MFSSWAVKNFFFFFYHATHKKQQLTRIGELATPVHHQHVRHPVPVDVVDELRREHREEVGLGRVVVERPQHLPVAAVQGEQNLIFFSSLRLERKTVQAEKIPFYKSPE